MELISREATVKLLDGWKTPDSRTEYGAGYNAALLDAIQAIQNGRVLPACGAKMDEGDESHV